MVHIHTGLSVSSWQKTSVSKESVGKDNAQSDNHEQTKHKQVSVSETVTLGGGTGSSNSGNVSGVEAYQAVKNEDANLNPYAKSIVSFIQLQLQRDVADGATQEQQQSRLQAGLDGFLQGFNEAYSQLKDSGLLSDEVVAAIGETRTQVLTEIDKMAEAMGVEPPTRPNDMVDLTVAPKPEEVTTPEATGASTPAPVAPESAPLDTQIIQSFSQSMAKMEETYAHLGKSKSSESSQVSAASARSFSFELKTQDGDAVTIRFEAKEANVGRNGVGGQALAGIASHQFNYEVAGDLDEGELKAIGELLEDVRSLSAAFFDGDIGRAFEMALELDHDEAEIASYALNLVRVDIQKAEADAPDDALPQPPVDDHVVSYIEQVKQLVERAEQNDVGLALLEALVETVSKLPGEEHDGEERSVGMGFVEVTHHIMNALEAANPEVAKS